MTLSPPPPGDPAGVARLLAAYMEAFPALEATHVALQREVERCQAELRRKNDELSQMAELARRHERLAALGEMAAGVAHEIRNPLGGIELYASHLARQLPEGPNRETCRKIIAATARLNRIITDMFAFTRGKPPQRRSCRPGQPVRAALDAAGPLLEQNGVRVTQDLGRAPDRCLLDPDLLSQAFLNIIQNAAQAMPEGGDLSITAEYPVVPATGTGAAGPWLRLRFADTGPGVPAEARDKLFNPFYTRRAEGTGLGLSITHKIIGDHGGQISVEDAMPRGAAFVVDLPAGPA